MTATRRSLLGIAALLAMPVRAQSGVARRYGVLSAMGDRLTVVAYQPTTGTRIDRNERWDVPIGSTQLDDAALLAVRSGLPPTAADGTAFYRVAPDQFPRWQAMVDRGTVAMPVDVASALTRDGVTHLVLVVKLRSAASVQIFDGRIGSGNLEGLGLYLDHGMEMRTRETGARGKGFIAPYVYVQLALVDVAAARIVARESVKVARAHSAATSATGRDPWEALSAEQKSQLIGDVIATDVRDATERLVAG